MGSDIILSSQELAGRLSELGCGVCPYDSLFDLIKQAEDQIEEQAEQEARKYSVIGVNKSVSTRDALVESIKDGFKSRKIKVNLREEGETVQLEAYGGNYFSMDVSVKHVSFGYNWSSVYIYYSSDNYMDIAKSLSSEDGTFYKLYSEKDLLRSSIWHYYDIQKKMNEEKALQSALSDDAKYDSVCADYSRKYSELLPFEQFCHILSWEEALREHGIQPALTMLDDIDRYTEGKSPESAARYMKRYNNAQNVISGALRRGMLSEEAAKRIVPWEEYIAPKVSGYSADTLVNEYLSSVQKAYESEMAACDARGTDYSAKKKKKILADMEVCRDLKARVGKDCFIDKSSFSRDVYHLNVILNGNNALVFRIPKKTPEAASLEPLVKLAKVLEEISAAVGKNIRLTSYSRKPDFKKLSVSAPKELKETASGLAAGLKKVKGGQLTVSSTYVTLALPVSGLEWCIKIRCKEAAGMLDSIAGLLAEYTAIHMSLAYSLNLVKGIYQDRMPNI